MIRKCIEKREIGIRILDSEKFDNCRNSYSGENTKITKL